MRSDENFVAGLEGRGVDARVGLDREHDTVNRPKDLVDLTNLGLVVEVGARVEVRHHTVRELVHHLVFAGVYELTELCSSAVVSLGKNYY